MDLFTRQAFARAGLMGNPSDGYNGKTISFIVRNFAAKVVLYEWDEVEIVRTHHETNRFRGVRDLVHDVKLHGYGGGVRLLKATIKRFVEYCERQRIPLHDRNFSIRYETDIPRQVGLAGSSAIIVAALRCLMDFYGVEIPKLIQPSLVMSIETEELGIAAGLQDRVIQVYEGVVAMDFTKESMRSMHGFSHGRYEPMDPSLLPPLYLAYSADRGEPTEVQSNNLRARYAEGDPKVHAAMRTFIDLTDRAKVALLARDHKTLGQLIDQNFDTRKSICPIAAMHLEMIETARSVGVSAKFAGSGGAILGICDDAATFDRLQSKMRAIQCEVVRPQVTNAPDC